MRVRHPDTQICLEVGGIDFGVEVHGTGSPDILLMPTWTIIHSRFWKFQVPYLARRHRVIIFDGPGNGEAPRSTDPADYAVEAFVERAVAVLDAADSPEAVVVGYSDGGKMAAAFAGTHPNRTLGLVLIAPALRVVPPPPDRAAIADNFLRPYAANPQGWDKYNAAYWLDHYEDFARFFFSEIFTESYTTKAEDDCVGWALETNGDVLVAEARRPPDPDHYEMIAAIEAPTMVVHGTDDHLVSFEAGARVAELVGGQLARFDGNGHAPHIKEPVRFNLLLEDFVQQVST